MNSFHGVTVHQPETAKSHHEDDSQIDAELCQSEAVRASEQHACRADCGQSATRQQIAARAAGAGATRPPEIVDVPAGITCALPQQRRQALMSWRMISVLGSLQSIERMLGKLREVIDTDNSIPPELRGELHTTVDEHLLSAKERLLKTVGEQ
ncbi:hypothetical protein [Bradyrhizobium sp. BWA-3-5]|uniref:hypothetical protein n=1 Tax=Bradyrhizobium sp. BWA-3-5 TaxID=3080013 RepID=UPI00293F5598|nr:hypothetical protein [Bradyrhizobium sp. BWA-3-5]WOH63823.1 hypothetical protein RX331_24370 [Bradyrhizobium sp. BWA-3-5]